MNSLKSYIEDKDRENRLIFELFCFNTYPLDNPSKPETLVNDYIVLRNIPYSSLDSRFKKDKYEIDLGILPVRLTWTWEMEGPKVTGCTFYDDLRLYEVKVFGSIKDKSVTRIKTRLPLGNNEAFTKEFEKIIQQTRRLNSLGNETGLLIFFINDDNFRGIGNIYDWFTAADISEEAARIFMQKVKDTKVNMQIIAIGKLPNRPLYQSATILPLFQNIEQKDHLSDNYRNIINKVKEKIDFSTLYKSHFPLQILACGKCYELFTAPAGCPDQKSPCCGENNFNFKES